MTTNTETDPTTYISLDIANYSSRTAVERARAALVEYFLKAKKLASTISVSTENYRDMVHAAFFSNTAQVSDANELMLYANGECIKVIENPALHDFAFDVR